MAALSDPTRRGVVVIQLDFAPRLAARVGSGARLVGHERIVFGDGLDEQEAADVLGISREALVIPLRTEAPGRIALMKDGKLEIVVDRDGDFEDWLKRLEPSIRSLMDLPESEPD